MPRAINQKLAAAWRAAGFPVSESGKVFTPPRELRPTPPPPGFSKLPEPKRSVADARRKPPPTVPHQVASVSEIPDRLRPLYVPAHFGNGYVRNAAGTVLASYRDQKARDPLAAPITRRATLTRKQWATLLSVAEPGPEREHFLRDAALKRITIERDDPMDDVKTLLTYSIFGDYQRERHLSRMQELRNQTAAFDMLKVATVIQGGAAANEMKGVRRSLSATPRTGWRRS